MDLSPQRLGLADRIRLAFVSNWRVALLLWIAGFLTVASFITTLQGFVTITSPTAESQSIVAWGLAALVTAGVQSLMLICAWMIGENVTRNRSILAEKSILRQISQLVAAVLLVSVFLVCLIVSAFFSFNTFYHAVTNIFGTACQGTACEGSQGNRNPYINNLARVYVGKIMAQKLTEMRAGAEEERQVTFDALTVQDSDSGVLSSAARKFRQDNPSIGAASSNWLAFTEKMREIVAISKTAMLLIADTVKRVHDENVKAQQEAAVRLEVAKGKQDLAKATIAQTETETGQLSKQIEQLQAKRGELDQRITELEQEVRAGNNAMECEEKGNQCESAVPTDPGPGPKWKAAKQKRDNAQIQLQQRQNEHNELIQRLQDLKKQLDSRIEQRNKAEQTLKAEAVTTSQGAAPKSLQLIPIEELNAVVVAMEKALGQMTDPAAFGASLTPATAATIRSTAFGNRGQVAGVPLSPALLRLEESCNTILTQLGRATFDKIGIDHKDFKDIGVGERVRQLSCARDGLSAAVERIQQLNAGITSFDVGDAKGTCRTLSSFRDKDTNTMIGRGQQCLEIVKLSGQPAEAILDTFGVLEREHNKNVHPFVQSQNGLFAYRDRLAWLSLFIATAIDMLVFFAGFFIASASLRHIDRIGSSHYGSGILGRIDASLAVPKPTDSETTRMKRWILERIEPRPHRFEEDGPLYAGYIRAKDLRLGVEEDEAVHQAVRLLVGEKRNGIPLVRTWPDGNQGRGDETGLMPNPWVAEAEVRYYFIAELLADLADDIRHWDRAFGGRKAPARSRDPADVQPTQPGSRPGSAARPRRSYTVRHTGSGLDDRDSTERTQTAASPVTAFRRGT